MARVCLSLFLIFYVRDELNYDRYNKKADRIFRIVSYIQERDKNTNWTLTQAPLAATLKKDYPEVEESARFMGKERTLFKYGENNFYETKIYYADSTVFRIFTYPFIEGNAAHALTEPNSIVISKTLADKYFGKNSSAIGKTLRTVYDVYKVTGVIQDVPHNSHLRFDMLISWSSLPKNQNGDGNWGNFNNFTYVLLKPATNATAFNKKLVPMYEKYMAPLFAQFNVKMHYGVQPITEIHLHSKLEREPEELGSMSYIWIFSAVAFFMMLIASINYMNLTTARSARRAKEIGIRKVLGASVQGLAGLLSKEFVQLVALSCLIAFPIAWLAMRNWLQDYQYRTTVQWWVFAIAGLTALAITLITVSFQTIKAAYRNPVKSLRTE